MVDQGKTYNCLALTWVIDPVASAGRIPLANSNCLGCREGSYCRHERHWVQGRISHRVNRTTRTTSRFPGLQLLRNPKLHAPSHLLARQVAQLERCPGPGGIQGASESASTSQQASRLTRDVHIIKAALTWHSAADVASSKSGWHSSNGRQSRTSAMKSCIAPSDPTVNAHLL
jgi:hypothetical protein